jgi:ubiquitin-conjugating enzyme E2 S
LASPFSELIISKIEMVSNVENLNPQVLRHIGRELQSLKSEPLEGIAVTLDDKDMTSVEALIDGPVDTPYHGGKFRVQGPILRNFISAEKFLDKLFPGISDKFAP